MYYEIEKNGLKNITMEDGSIIPMREYVVRIPAADDGVSGVGMVSRTCGTKTVATFNAYTVDISNGVPSVKTEFKTVEFDGQPGIDKITEAIDKNYPAHGDIFTELVPGETVGLPAELFRDIAVKVIRPQSQR